SVRGREHGRESSHRTCFCVPRVSRTAWNGRVTAKSVQGKSQQAGDDAQSRLDLGHSKSDGCATDGL
nr:hypothetical protein [Nostoc sp. EkiNYC01]